MEAVLIAWLWLLWNVCFAMELPDSPVSQNPLNLPVRALPLSIQTHCSSAVSHVWAQWAGAVFLFSLVLQLYTHAIRNHTALNITHIQYIHRCLISSCFHGLLFASRPPYWNSQRESGASWLRVCNYIYTIVLMIQHKATHSHLWKVLTFLLNETRGCTTLWHLWKHINLSVVLTVPKWQTRQCVTTNTYLWLTLPPQLYLPDITPYNLRSNIILVDLIF